MSAVLASLINVLFSVSHGQPLFFMCVVAHKRTCFTILWFSLLITWLAYVHFFKL